MNINVEYKCFLSSQSIINHIYWVAISSTTPKEREEKWLSLLNHIVNIHSHKENQIFRRCTHEVIEREWMVAGKNIFHTVNNHLATSTNCS